MKTATLRASELAAAGTWAPEDLLGGEPPYVCRECGLAPKFIETPTRPNPVVALLEPDGPRPRDPYRRSWYRCRDRAACAERASRPSPD